MHSIHTTHRLRGAVSARIIAPIAVVVGLLTYVAVAGSTGFCPTCQAIVSTVFGSGGEGTRTIAEQDVRTTDGDSIHALVMSDVDGNPVPLSRFRGRPMIIDVWATWCAPCRSARKVLHGIAEEIAEHGEIVSVSVDAGGAEVVRDFIDKHEDGDSRFVELISTDPAFTRVIRPHDRKPTIPKLIYVSSNGRILDIEYGVPNPKWVLNRVKQMASADSRG